LFKQPTYILQSLWYLLANPVIRGNMAYHDSGRASSISVSTAYHSCLEDDLPETYYKNLDDSPYIGEPESLAAEPAAITKIYYEELRQSLGNQPRLGE
jgi:hypothetical protein